MDLIADAVLEASGCQLALLPAQSATGTLEQGAVFQSDLERIIPVDQTLVTASFSLLPCENCWKSEYLT